MPRTLGWAIVGIGVHADRYIAPALRRAKGARLVAVYSRDQGRAEAFAQKHGAQRGYSDLEALLSAPAVQAVYIASPNALHAPQTIACARAGKHVLCEKPMAITAEDARAMVEACSAAGVKLGVGFHLRHHPAHIQARRYIQEGTLGEPSLAWAQWHPPWGRSAPYSDLRAWKTDPSLAGAGVLVGYGVHCIDLLRYLLGREVVEVAAFTDATPQRPPSAMPRARPDAILSLSKEPAEGAGLDDQVTGLLRFQGGAMGLIANSRRIPASRSTVEVHGPRGSLFSLGTLTQGFAGDLELVLRERTLRTGYQRGDLYQAQLEAFCQAVAEDREPDASGIDGLKAVEITQAILRSQQEGQAISLLPRL